MDKTKIFAQGARVVCFGDSITHGGTYHAYMQQYYRTNLPERGVKIFNGGINGNKTFELIRRLDVTLDLYRPTEMLVFVGINDLYQYRAEVKTEKEEAENRAILEKHLSDMQELLTKLTQKGLPVTLCSPLGKDLVSAPEEPLYPQQVAITSILPTLWAQDRAFPGLKNAIDCLTPYQTLHNASVRLGGTPLFRPCRLHPNDVGQRMLARIMLRGQGLDVALPSAEELNGGFTDVTLDPDIAEACRRGYDLNRLFFSFEGQVPAANADAVKARVAYWEKELPNITLPWRRELAEFFIANAEKEKEIESAYLAAVNAL